MSVNKLHLALWDRKLPSYEEFTNLPWKERLEIFVWLGHMAPSSHNTQPWRFYCDPDNKTLVVFLDRALVLPESDVVGREAVISLGCAIENIVTAADGYGQSTTVKTHHVKREILRPRQEKLEIGKELIPFATLKFAEGVSSSSSLVLTQAMLTRKVMRAEFDPNIQIEERVLEELQQSITDETTELHLIHDSIRKLSISEFQGQADSYVLNSPRFAGELGDWLLSNDTASATGMPGNTFGFDDEQAGRISSGLRGESKLEPEDMLKFSLGGKIGFEKSPTIAFITISTDDVPEWIAAGRAMERAFLILEREGISFAVHAAIVEVRLINRIFAATLGTFKPLAAVFRIGHVKDAASKISRPHSPRQPLSAVLLPQLPD